MSEEKKGFFGFFKGNSADPPEQKPADKDEIIDFTTTFTQTLLDKMGFFTVVKLQPTKEEEEIHLEIKGDEMGLIIGKEGVTLNALQLLVNIVALKKFGPHSRIVLDAEDYRQKRLSRLEEIAKKAADTANQSGREVVLEPMSPAERRIIHITLKEDKRITTRSIGQGNDRKVIVSSVKRKDNFFLP